MSLRLPPAIRSSVARSITHPMRLKDVGPSVVVDPWYYVIDPEISTAFTLSGSLIDTHTDRGKTLTGLSQKCTLDSVHLLNGKKVVATSQTGFTRLSTTTGGVTGNAAHSMFAVVRQRNVSSALLAFAIFGNFAQLTSAMGYSTSNTTWGGGKNFGSPTNNRTPAAGTVAVVAKIHDPAIGGTWILVDGLSQYASNQASPTANVYNLSPGFGIETWDGFNHMPDADIAWLGWRTSSPTLRAAQDIIRALADAYGLSPIPSRIECHGDSITNGTIGTNQTPLPYPAVLQSDLISRGFPGVVTGNNGVPGYTTGQLLDASLLTPLIDNKFTRRANQSWYIIMAGTNDVNPTNAIDPSVVIANLTSLMQGRKALGYRVGAMILFPPDTSGSLDANAVARRAVVNAWLRTAVSLGLCEFLVDCETPANVATYGDMSTTAFHSDLTHPNAAGYAALGHMVADALVAVGFA